jgi:membrane protease YdiL (CAAX protease family)
MSPPRSVGTATRAAVAVRSRALAAVGPAVLVAAALVPWLRPGGAVVLAAGWLVLWRTGRPEAIAWAAVLPVGVMLAWPWVLGSDVPLGEVACTSPVSVIVLRRVAMAGVVLGIVAALAVAHRSGVVELGLRRPSVAEAAVAIAGCLVLVVGGLAIGPAIAAPFFGPLDFPVPTAALLPAIVFGVANGVTEEVAYRGAMQGWTGRLAPVWVAIAFQGLVFGVVHAGPEVTALLPLHVGLLAAVGIAAGVVRWRVGSLWIPAGIHVGADVALYVGLACRAAA